MPENEADQAHIRAMLKQLSKMAVIEIEERRAEKEASIPPLIKWLVGAIATLGVTALVGLGIWLVSSVSTMRETLAVINERMENRDTAAVVRYDDLSRRVVKLESYNTGDQNE